MSVSFKDFLSEIKNKKITVLGIGISNTPVISMLAKAGARVTACDKNEKSALGDCTYELEALGVQLCCGKDYLDNIDADIIIKTPGMRFDIPQLVKARENGAKVVSEMELFFKYCPCKIIAVTGSDGKTTTTSLIYEMLRCEGYTVHLGGNIGRPLLPRIESISENDIVVAELSSFQLHTMTSSPHIAVVTNLSPNHLDVHKSMEEYIDAKTNIFKYQTPSDTLVVNYCNEITNSFTANGALRKFAFNAKPDTDGAYYEDGKLYLYENGEKTLLMERDDILLRGDHNVENYLAAILAVKELVKKETVVNVARSFSGVRHRIEFVRERNGVKFYNDSIGSSPTRTIATLRSFDEKVILIAGGYDKNLPFDTLAKELPLRVKELVLTGATAQKIKAALENNKDYDGKNPCITLRDDFEDAVKTAASLAREGDCVVLSPACASFDKFKNFEVRGDKFIEIVNSLEEQ
ncbi:MAG: UDP-N-acetylmuramoyl-L-alanine--D-glutamate ligase [Clostridia bacterium]|nr:UDP-N-acetylmuramoyl-L-alanine--D-glutamate ligase [Clostridia bacterium]